MFVHPGDMSGKEEVCKASRLKVKRMHSLGKIKSRVRITLVSWRKPKNKCSSVVGDKKSNSGAVFSLACHLTLGVLLTPEMEFCIYEIVTIMLFIAVALRKLSCDNSCKVLA